MTTDVSLAARSLLEAAVAQRVAPGAVLHAVAADGRELKLAVGGLTYDPAPVPTTEDTFYDLASLTKVVACLPLLLHVLAAGEVRLEDKVSRFFSNAGWFQEPSLGDVTIEDLALHRSGLPAWKPLFATVGERRTAVANVLQTGLSDTAGAFVYSDLGVIVLGAVIERVLGERLDAAFSRVVAEPMGLTSLRFGPLPAGTRVAPTEDDGLRGGVLYGVVHDENAWTMDGVSAHAGLFGAAGDLSRYADAWLRLEAPFAPSDWLAAALADRSGGVGPARGLLWRLKDEAEYPIGDGVSRRAFGHTGFTGTSIAVDPEAGWTCVLLTNRVHPRRGDAAHIAGLRRSVHELVARAFGG